MSEWVDSREAAAMIGCQVKSLAGYLRKGKQQSSVRKKDSGNCHYRVLYNKSDIEALIAHKKQHASRERQYTPVIDGSMWHPAMSKPWNKSGMEGVFND